MTRICGNGWARPQREQGRRGWWCLAESLHWTRCDISTVPRHNATQMQLETCAHEGIGQSALFSTGYLFLPSCSCSRVFKIKYEMRQRSSERGFWGVEAFTNTLWPRIERGGMPVDKPTQTSRAKPPSRLKAKQKRTHKRKRRNGNGHTRCKRNRGHAT